MHLSEHDLRQLDESKLATLPEETLRILSGKLLADLKESREQLNQNPANSSRPSGAMPPWYSTTSDPNEQVSDDESEEQSEKPSDSDSEGERSGNTNHSVEKTANSDSAAQNNPTSDANKNTSSKKPGRQKGSQGYGRTQKLPIDEEIEHYPKRCRCCNSDLKLSMHSSQAYTACYEIDIQTESDAQAALHLIQTKHICYEIRCDCGHTTRYYPHKESANKDWSVAINDHHLIGPSLASLIVFMATRMRLSRTRIREFLQTWLNLTLCTGVIHQTIDEAARCLEPVEQEIIDAVIESGLLHIDETSWRQTCLKLWLWVVVGTTATWYTINKRGRVAIQRILFNDKFIGWLMSDGWHVYREYGKRLRCLAHLERKARGLSESLNHEAATFGQEALRFIEWMMESVYTARQLDEIPIQVLYKQYKKSHIDPFIALCHQHFDSEHKKVRALAREFCYDEEAIFAVLDFPDLPLTNNVAERALRHWVIMRRLTYGTRTAQGSRTLSLLASVIDTCRQRRASPWTFIADTIRNRRKGLPALSLPAMAN